MALLGDGAQIDILAAVSGLLLATGLVLALAGLLVTALDVGRRQQLGSALAAVRDCATMVCSGREVRQKCDILDQKMTTAKVRQFRVTVQCYSLGAIYGTCSMLYELLCDCPHSAFHSHFHFLVMSISNLHIVTIALLWPSSITPSSLDFHYFLLVLPWTVVLSPPLQSEDSLFMSLLMSNTWVAFLNGARRTMPGQRLPFLAICNIGFALSASSSIVMHVRASSHPLAGMILQLGWVGLMCFGAVSLEAGFRAIVFRDIELEEVKELHAAALSVLRSYCEVVLELDSEGYITASADDLSCFLLRRPLSHPQSHSCSQRSRLVDFISCEDDQQLFMERLAASQELRSKSGIAETVQVTMRDGCNNTLRLELMWFQFRRRDQRQHFMLGIREFRDVPVQRTWDMPSGLAFASGLVEDHSSMNEAQGQSLLDRAKAAGRRGSGQEHCLGTASEAGSDGAGTSSACSSVPEDAAAGPPDIEEITPMLVVDTMGPGMPIIGFTPAFCTRIGRLPLQRPILKYVKNSLLFQTSIQQALNSLSYGEDPPECRVTLQMPSGQSIRTTVRVVVAPSVEDEDGGEVDLDLQHVGLVFSKTRSLAAASSCGASHSGGSFRGTPHRAGQGGDPDVVTARVSL